MRSADRRIITLVVANQILLNFLYMLPVVVVCPPLTTVSYDMYFRFMRMMLCFYIMLPVEQNQIRCFVKLAKVGVRARPTIQIVHHLYLIIVPFCPRPLINLKNGTRVILNVRNVCVNFWTARAFTSSLIGCDILRYGRRCVSVFL